MSYPIRRFRFAGFCLIIVIMLCDQWSKTALTLAAQSGDLPREILPFFNLVMVHNHGISFGFFSHGQSWMPVFLTVMTSLVVLVLIVWLMRATEGLVALALGCIIGGALGNIADRARLGSVTDFLDFHWQSYHWPAFNLADSAIFIGVVILVLISIVRPAVKKEHEK